MKVGDLVRYVSLYEHIDKSEQPNGIIITINDDGYYEVLWQNGYKQEDLVYSELEVVGHG